MTTEQTLAPQDENQIIAERRAKLKAIREKGVAFPNDFERKNLAADLHAEFGEKTHDELEAAQIHGRGGRTHDAEARDGQGQLRHHPGHERPHPALHQQRRHRRRSA